MKINVIYSNTSTREYEEYTTTLRAFVASCNGLMSMKAVRKVLTEIGEAVIENGNAVTTVRLVA